LAGQSGPKINSFENPEFQHYLNPTNIKTDGTYIKDVPFNYSFDSQKFYFLENKTDFAFLNSKDVYHCSVKDFSGVGSILASGLVQNDLVTIRFNGSLTGIYVNDEHFIDDISIGIQFNSQVFSVTYNSQYDYTDITYNSVIGQDGDVVDIYLGYTNPLNREYKTFKLNKNSPIINSSTQSFSIAFFCKPSFSTSFFGPGRITQNGFFKRHRRSYLFKCRNIVNDISILNFGHFAPPYNTNSGSDYKYKFDEICFVFIFKDSTNLRYCCMTDLVYKSDVWNFIALTFDYLKNTIKFFVNGEQVYFYNSPRNPILERPNRNRNSCVHRTGFLDFEYNVLPSQNEINGVNFSSNVDEITTTHKGPLEQGNQNQNSFYNNNNYNEFGRLFIYDGVVLQPNQIQLLFKNYRGQYLI
jgi:hypothetical protein